MKLLLDTHTILWMVNEHEKLSSNAKALLANDEHTLFISIVSLWEIAIKASLGKLAGLSGGVGALIAHIDHMPVTIYPISPAHVEAVESLPFIHRDPFDRILIATAMTDGMTIVTADGNIKKYSVSCFW